MMNELDTLPPHTLTDERGVLSCCLQGPSECLPECLHVNDACFYDERHKAVWQAVHELSTSNSGIDQATVTRKLTEMGHGNIATEYLSDLIDASPSPHNLGYYLPSLFDYALKRRVIRGCSKLSAIAQNGVTSAELMAKAEQFLSIERPESVQTVNGQEAGLTLIDDLERRYALEGKLSGIPTGLVSLDAKTEGLQYGDQTLIGARPSRGKTALGLTIFHEVVFRQKMPALFVSLEMSVSALMRRLLSIESELTMHDIRRGSYNEGQFQKMTAFRSKIHKLPMFITDGVRGLSATEICYQVKKLVRKHGIKLVIVDYLQKIKPDSRHEKRTYEIADVSGKLKSLATETKCAFLTLAQLNRENEKDKGRAPRLADLGDSGQIERDADTVILIDRKAQDADTRLIIAKQRDGETGLAYVTFNGQFCRFENPQTHYD